MIIRIFEGVDLDGSGKIRYTEFLAATIEVHGAIDEERLAEAFDRIDCDDSGYISFGKLCCRKHRSLYYGDRMIHSRCHSPRKSSRAFRRQFP